MDVTPAESGAPGERREGGAIEVVALHRLPERFVPILDVNSEMARRVLAFDWSATPLGALELWSHDLRVAANICLSAALPMHLWWGDELTFLYNDAYRAFLGAADPGALGRCGREACADIWNRLESAVDAVFKSGRAHVCEDVPVYADRSVAREERYLTFCFSPVFRGGGGVAGAVCACTDTTEQVISIRRLETLRNLGAAKTARGSVDAAMVAGMDALRRNRRDVAFAACYRIETATRIARRVATIGELVGVAAPPDTIALDAESSAWPWRVGPLASGHAHFQEIDLHGVDLQLRDGEWPETPERAAMLALHCAGDDEVAGFFVCGVSSRRPLDAKYRDFLALAADRLSAAIAYARHREDERLLANERAQLAADLDAVVELNAMAGQLLHAPTLGAVFALALDATMTLQGADCGMLQAFDRETHSLSVVTQRGLTPEFIERHREAHVTDGSAAGRALQRRERVLIPDVEFDTGYAPHSELLREAGVRAAFVVALVGADGEPFGVLSTYFRDGHMLSERELRFTDLFLRLASAAIDRRRDEEALRAADRRKDEFLAILAHELRNPLAPIRNALQLMKLKGGLAPVLQNARDLMERQVSYMVRLVEDLLEVSRITRGRIHLRDERIDLCAVISSAVEASRPLIDAQNHALTVELPSEPLYVDGDPTRLTQIFFNLLNNAAKYTGNGGHIELGAARQNHEIRVQIKDNGVGIPRHMLGRIFDMFMQVDASDDHAQGGLGIGLTLVRQLVELHGGRIVADSDGVGTGSTFTVYLPAAAARVADATPTYEHAIDETANVAPRKVLIADDNSDAANSLGAMLAESGHEVRIVYDGADAVRAADEFAPDIALLDLAMPRMNGFEAARRIRALPNGRNVFLAALTGWGQDQDRRRTREAGFDEHLIKPVSTDVLMRTIARAQSRRAT